MDQQRFENLDVRAKENAVRFYTSGVARFNQSPMDGFDDLWRSFNNWFSCVTDADRDSAQLRELAADRGMQQLFDDLWNNDNLFREQLLEFSDEWPIYDSSSILEQYGPGFASKFSTRAELLIAIEGDPGLKKSPRNWVPGSNPTQSQTLWAIYQVRCNRFHGRKSAHVEDDVRLVQLAFSVLIRLIDKIGYATTPAESP